MTFLTAPNPISPLSIDSSHSDHASARDRHMPDRRRYPRPLARRTSHRTYADENQYTSSPSPEPRAALMPLRQSISFATTTCATSTWAKSAPHPLTYARTCPRSPPSSRSPSPAPRRDPHPQRWTKAESDHLDLARVVAQQKALSLAPRPEPEADVDPDADMILDSKSDILKSEHTPCARTVRSLSPPFLSRAHEYIPRAYAYRQSWSLERRDCTLAPLRNLPHVPHSLSPEFIQGSSSPHSRSRSRSPSPSPSPSLSSNGAATTDDPDEPKPQGVRLPPLRAVFPRLWQTADPARSDRPMPFPASPPRPLLRPHPEAQAEDAHAHSYAQTQPQPQLPLASPAPRYRFVPSTPRGPADLRRPDTRSPGGTKRRHPDHARADAPPFVFSRAFASPPSSSSSSSASSSSSSDSSSSTDSPSPPHTPERGASSNPSSLSYLLSASPDSDADADADTGPRKRLAYSPPSPSPRALSPSPPPARRTYAGEGSFPASSSSASTYSSSAASSSAASSASSASASASAASSGAPSFSLSLSLSPAGDAKQARSARGAIVPAYVYDTQRARQRCAFAGCGAILTGRKSETASHMRSHFLRAASAACASARPGAGAAPGEEVLRCPWPADRDCPSASASAAGVGAGASGADPNTNSNSNSTTSTTANEEGAADGCCGMAFKDSANFGRHVSSKHIRAEEYQCKRCGRPFSRRDAALRHMKTLCRVDGAGAGAGAGARRKSTGQSQSQGERRVRVREEENVPGAGGISLGEEGA